MNQRTVNDREAKIGVFESDRQIGPAKNNDVGTLLLAQPQRSFVEIRALSVARSSGRRECDVRRMHGRKFFLRWHNDVH